MSKLKQNGVSLLIFVILMISSELVGAQSKGISFQASIKRPDGSIPTVAGLTVTLQILDPTSGCVLREEQHSGVNISNGYMSLIIGNPAASTPLGLNPSPILSIKEVMDNSVSRTGLKCVDADNVVVATNQTYSPTDSDIRKIRLRTVIEGDDLIADFSMRAVAFAVNSETLGGKGASDFIQGSSNITQNRVESIFSQFTSLTNILNGNYSGNAATATSATNATNVTGVVSIANGGTGATTAGAALNALLPNQAGQSGKVLTTNGTSSSWTAVTSGVSSVAGKTGAVNLVAADISDFSSAADGRITLQKGAASGLATLTSGSLVPTSQLGTGTADNTTYLRGDGAWSAISSSDSTKLPLSGGTMSGSIDMSSGNLLNIGFMTMATGKSLQLSSNSSDPAGLLATDKGKIWFNSSTNDIKYWNGTSVQTLGVSGAGLSSLNGQTGSSQSFAVGTSGTAPAFSSGSGTHTLNIPMAVDAGVTAGLLSKADYDAFSSKQASGNYMTSLSGDVTATGPGAAVATIAGDAVTSAKILNSTIVGADMNFTGVNAGTSNLVVKDSTGKFFDFACATAGEVATWTVSGWACQAASLGYTPVNKAGDSMSGALTLNAANEVRFADADSSHYVGLRSPATVSANKVWTLPAGDGTSGQVLSTDGAGNLGWSSGGTQWGVTGNDIYYTTGKVGVGTATPAATLDVNGYAKLKLNTAAPASCSSGLWGALAMNSGADLCVCKPNDIWTDVKSGSACLWSAVQTAEMTITIPHNNFYCVTEVQVYDETSTNIMTSLTAANSPGTGMAGLAAGKYVFDTTYVSHSGAPAPLSDGNLVSCFWNSDTGITNKVYIKFNAAKTITRVRVHFYYMQTYGDPRTTSIAITGGSGTMTPQSQSNTDGGVGQGYREFNF